MEASEAHQPTNHQRTMDQQESQAENIGGGPPEYGILTRTLVHSPVVKQILPARIRGVDLNDVVFIGESFVELYKFTENAKLQQVACKTDFRAVIRDARVFGLQRRSNLSGVLGNNLLGADENEDVKSGLPPEILAMTLDSGHLAFMYAKSLPKSEQVDFVVSRRRIDSKGVHPRNLGKSVAVDPQSRAMAVTAYQDYLRIYALHPMDELHRQMEEGLPLNPIKEEKTFAVKASLILHMEFLYPSQNDPSQVILILFLIDREQKSRLQLYEWHTSKPLKTAAILGHHGLRLSDEITLPLHLIPLVIRSAFLIVTELHTYVVKASDIISGNAVFPKIPFPATTSHDRMQKLVTAWARPFRHPEYSGLHDDMYIALENGDIYFLEVDAEAHSLVQTATKASHLECAIGTAFAVLDNGLGYNDVLVAGGEMSSGGIYLVNIAPFPVHAATEANAKLEASVTNWAPVIDFELVNLSARGKTHGIAERDRVFACTGRGDHGAITELRYGLQAGTQEPIEYLQGVRRLFILPDVSGKGYFVLSSLADQSVLVFLSPLNGGEWFECEQLRTLDLNEPTLAAGRLRQSRPTSVVKAAQSMWAIQITPSAITIAQLLGDVVLAKREDDVEMATNDPPMRRLQRRCDGGDTIIAAALHGEFVVITLRNGEDIKLVLASVVIQEANDEFLVPIGSPIALAGDPTFVGVVKLRDRLMTVVGTRQATVQIFLCDSSRGLLPLKEHTMLDNTTFIQDDLSFCESAVILSTDAEAMMLCGLRGGSVVVFNVVPSKTSFDLVRMQDMHFGPIPVQLHLDVHRDDTAYALAGPEVYRFDIQRGDFRAAQIFFNVPDSAMDPAMKAVVQVDNSPDPENIFVCVTNDHIFCAEVDGHEKVCGRRLGLQATPRRLLFYRRLDVFLVACSRTEFEPCTLRIIDPMTGQSRLPPGPLQNAPKRDQIFGAWPSEHIYFIAEWNMEINGKAYQYIALGTGFRKNSPDESKTGRLIILSLNTNATTGLIDVSRRFQVFCDDPVYSLAQYKSSSLVYCTGKHLYLKQLNMKTKKLDTVAELILRSPAVKISVAEPYIYLSCAYDSVMILKLENNVFTESFSSEAARNGFHHAKLGENLILATDKQSTVIGLLQPEYRRTLQSLQQVFEAETQSSISNLRLGYCRPPWRSRRASPLPGVMPQVEENILASGVDGSFHQITVMRKDALELVRYVLECHRGGDERPVVSGPEEAELMMQVTEHGMGRKDSRGNWVDLDLIKGVEKLGGEWLRGKVEGDDRERRRYGGSGWFDVTARRVLGIEDGVGEDLYSAVMKWVKDLVEDAIL